MPAHTRLQKRAGTYYFRTKIPQDLQSFLQRKEFKKSLRTKDLKTAKKRVVEESFKFNQWCDQEREKLKRITQPVEVLPLNETTIKSICDQYRYMTLAGDEILRLEPTNENEQLRKVRQQMSTELRTELANSNIEASIPALSQFLTLNHLQIDASDEIAYRTLLYRFTQTLAETNQNQILRDHGEVIKTPINTSATKPHQPKVTFEDVLKKWAGSNPTLNKNTIAMTERTVQLFKKITKKRSMDQIVRDDLYKFAEKRQQDGRAPKTVRKEVGFIVTLFNIAIDRELLNKNPATNIKIRHSKKVEVPRKIFSEDDLRKIFCMGKSASGKKLGKNTAKWLPLLALYTGCRPEELAQARVRDIGHEKGIPYFYVNNDKDVNRNLYKCHPREKDKELKTETSKRKIPLHPDIIAAGFMDYVKKLETNNQLRLFPDLELSNQVDPKYYTYFGTRFSAFLKQLDLREPGKVFYSFRHTFKTACRNSGIEEKVSEYLMGHKNAGISDNYGDPYSIQFLHQEIQKITYPIMRPRKHNK